MLSFFNLLAWCFVGVLCFAVLWVVTKGFSDPVIPDLDGEVERME